MIFALKDANFARKRKKQEILRNINFELEKGEVLSILGKNGAGKTTLVKCIMGLLKWDSGASILQGRDLNELSRKEIWQNIAYVAQAKSHIFNISVLDMVVLGCNPFVRFSPQKVHKERAIMALEKLHIRALESQSCARLSGGELQMVLFARALVKEPKILVLDELESNLDFANQKIILEMLKNLSKDGCTIIINTHFPTHARYLSHKVLLLKKIDDNNIESRKIGQSNALFGRTKEVLTEENLTKLYGVRVGINTYCNENEFVLQV